MKTKPVLEDIDPAIIHSVINGTDLLVIQKSAMQGYSELVAMSKEGVRNFISMDKDVTHLNTVKEALLRLTAIRTENDNGKLIHVYPVDKPAMLIEVTLDTNTLSKKVAILSRFHTPKRNELSFTFSLDFTNDQIIESPEVMAIVAKY